MTRSWFLPPYFTYGQLTIDDGLGIAESDEFTFVIPFIPIYVRWDHCRFERYGKTSWQRVTYSPFWFESESHQWDTTQSALEAWGVPLLYAHASIAPHSNRAIHLHHALLGLAPTVVYGPDWWVVTGPVGPLTWLSASTKSTEVHGPLGGLLGLIYSKREGGGYFRLLGGSLWDSSWNTRTNNDVPQFTESAHGPLWTLLGWGRDQRGTFLRLFGFDLYF